MIHGALACAAAVGSVVGQIARLSGVSAMSAVRDLIETDSGNLVMPGQKYLVDGYRHATIPYVSTDKGKSWKETAVLDSGGRGHHDGSIESCVVELKDAVYYVSRLVAGGRLPHAAVAEPEVAHARLERHPCRRGLEVVHLAAVRLHPLDRPRPAEAGPQRIPPGVRNRAGVQAYTLGMYVVPELRRRGVARSRWQCHPRARWRSDL